MTAVARHARVLVGMDFDDASVSALALAGSLASAWKAEITVLHAARPELPAYFTEAQFDTLAAEREQHRAAAVAAVRTFAAPHLAQDVHVVIGEGPAQDELLRVADSFDLIVVGTHRRHGPRRWWLGSVAEAVVRRSTRPVLVVPAGAESPEPGRSPVVLIAGHPDAAMNEWIDLFRTTLGAAVVHSPDVGHCSPERIQDASLLMLPRPGDDAASSQFNALVEVLKDCARPALFVPSTTPIVERSSS